MKFYLNKKILAIVDQIIISGSNFILSYLLTMKLTSHDFGLYSLFFSILMLAFSIVNALVFQPYQINTHSSSKINKFNIITSSGVLIFLNQFVISIVLYFSTYLNIYSSGFLLYLGLYIFHEMNRKILLVEENYNKLLLIDFISYGIRIVIVLAILYKQEYGEYIFYILGISYLIALLVCKNNFISMKWLGWNEYYYLGKWLLGSVLIYWLTTQANIFLLGYFSSLEKVGIFSALLVPFGLVRIILISSESFLLSKGAKQLIGNSIYHQYRIKFFNDSKLFLGIISVLHIILYLFSSEFLHFFYQTRFDNYDFLFRLLIVYSFLQSIVFFINIFYKVINKTKELFHINQYTFYFGLLIVAPLVYMYDIIGLIFGIILISTLNLILLSKNVLNV